MGKSERRGYVPRSREMLAQKSQSKRSPKGNARVSDEIKQKIWRIYFATVRLSETAELRVERELYEPIHWWLSAQAVYGDFSGKTGIRRTLRYRKQKDLHHVMKEKERKGTKAVFTRDYTNGPLGLLKQLATCKYTERSGLITNASVPLNQHNRLSGVSTQVHAPRCGLCKFL